MDSHLRSASVYSHHQRPSCHSPCHELISNEGISTFADSPSKAHISFAIIPEIATSFSSEPELAWMPSLDDPPTQPSILLRRSVHKLPIVSSVLAMACKRSLDSSTTPGVRGITQLVSWTDSMQAMLLQFGDLTKFHSSKRLSDIEGQKQGMFFCSVGLAGREIEGVRKFNILQAEASLVSHNRHASENDSNSVGGSLLISRDSPQRCIEVDSSKRNKEVSENSLFVTVKHLSAGAISAIVSRTFVAPLERLKLEYMVRGAQNHVLQIIRAIVTKEGVGGFWRGNIVNLLRTAPFKSVNFFCYDVYRKKLLEITGNEEVSNFERLVAGAAAGISATLLCFPMDTIRTRLVAPGGESLGGVVGCVEHMLRTEGFLSLYKGLVPALISIAPSCAVFYGVYDILKTSYLQSPEGQEDLRKRIEMERQRRNIDMKVQGHVDLKEEAGNLGQLELGPLRTLMYGAIAGICAETATYPLEVVRRQLQMQDVVTKMGALATCRGLVQRGGVAALYSGLLPSSLQVLPSASISYLVYECMKVILKV